MTEHPDATTEDPRAALATALAQRDALKQAGDALVYQLSHPSKQMGPVMDAIVAYRRVSEELDHD
jgi:hypothetical protein